MKNQISSKLFVTYVQEIENIQIPKNIIDENVFLCAQIWYITIVCVYFVFVW